MRRGETMLNYLINATGLRKFQVIIISCILMMLLIVSLVIATAYFKEHYINQGKQFVIDQLLKAQKQQKQKDQETIKHAKQIDQSINTLSDSDIHHRLRNDFRDNPENGQKRSLSTMDKDQPKPQRHQGNTKTNPKEQSETHGVLPAHCYLTITSEGNRIEVCDD